MTTKTDKGLPAFDDLDTYDDGFPNDVAGFVESGAHIDPASDIVHTHEGEDVTFHGDKLRHPKMHEGEDVGPASINARVHKAVADSRERDERRPVRDTCDAWRAGNVTMTGQSIRLVIRNNRRRSITITNQDDANTVRIGATSGETSTDPATALLAPGQSRTMYHTAEVWVIGDADTVVDFVEESYDS